MHEVDEVVERDAQVENVKAERGILQAAKERIAVGSFVDLEPGRVPGGLAARGEAPRERDPRGRDMRDRLWPQQREDERRQRWRQLSGAAARRGGVHAQDPRVPGAVVRREQ